jgi:ATP11 protein
MPVAWWPVDQGGAFAFAHRSFGADAPASFLVTYYPELVKEKGIVLVRGDVVNPAVVSVPEVHFFSLPCASLSTLHAHITETNRTQFALSGML